MNDTLTYTINSESRPNVSIELINDEVFELDETFLVRLRFTDPPPPRTNITTEEVVITIVDDDGKLKPNYLCGI